MVYAPVTITSDPIRALAVRYAPAAARPAVAALLALDVELAAVVRTTREPIVGQMRLVWWDDRLRALDRGETTAQPVLAALASIPVDGAALAEMIDGWESLLGDEPRDTALLERYATARGATLFAAIAAVCGAPASDPVEHGGKGWALADLAGNVADPMLAMAARALAQPFLDASCRWSRRGRGLGALVHAARYEDRAPPRRLARLLYHWISGH